jgi:hypothetical protein
VGPSTGLDKVVRILFRLSSGLNGLKGTFIKPSPKDVFTKNKQRQQKLSRFFTGPFDNVLNKMHVSLDEA